MTQRQCFTSEHDKKRVTARRRRRQETDALLPGITRKFAPGKRARVLPLSSGMRTDASHMCASTCDTALCLACHRPLESHRQTVLDTYVVELWWCRACNMWWGNGASQRDSNDRTVFCRTSPSALAARLDRLASLDPPVGRRS